MSNDAMQFLMSSGVTSAAFPNVGTKVEGKVLAFEKRQQRDIDGNKKFWDDGEPMWQIVFTVDTGIIDPSIEDDDGVRNIYAKAQMLNAIRDAIKKSGHKGDLVGGRLGVMYYADGEKKNKGYNAPKLYKAKFEAPAESDSLDDVRVEPEESFDEYSDDVF
jgi:hypothetical protein